MLQVNIKVDLNTFYKLSQEGINRMKVARSRTSLS